MKAIWLIWPRFTIRVNGRRMWVDRGVNHVASTSDALTAKMNRLYGSTRNREPEADT